MVKRSFAATDDGVNGPSLGLVLTDEFGKTQQVPSQRQRRLNGSLAKLGRVSHTHMAANKAKLASIVASTMKGA